jgi:predicted nucleotidyltransferase
MELIRQTVKVGNSAGVILPKEWLNTEVKVVLQPRDIEKGIVGLLIKEKLLEHVKGIYLIGSYARGEESIESDIDVLVVTDNVNKILNKEKYEILLISEENLVKKLPKNLYLISAIKEGVPIINKDLLEKLKKIRPAINLKSYKKEIEGILKINKEMTDFAEENNKKVLDGTIYSLVLRLRELYLLRIIKSNKKVSKKEFLKFVGKSCYNAYSRVKRDQKAKDDVGVEDANKLYNLTRKWLKS